MHHTHLADQLPHIIAQAPKMHTQLTNRVRQPKNDKCKIIILTPSKISNEIEQNMLHKKLQNKGRKRVEYGVTLIELLVGLAIGLVVIGVAMGALMISRGVTGTVSDASSMNQQAAYAMRVIGMQLRQAGSLRLNLEPGTAAIESRYLSPVAFEAVTAASGTARGFTPKTDTLTGAESPTSITAGYRRYAESVFGSASAQTLARNCTGGPGDTNLDERIESVFSITGSQLMCSGNGAAAQPVVQNVANFEIRYRVQDNTTIGIPKMRTASAADVANWAQVQAVEVCIELYGTERISMPAGSTYRNCAGTAIDMTTLPGDRASRSHITYKNVFQLRSQGLIGSVL